MHLRTQRDPGVADIRDTGSPHGRPWLGIAPASGSHSRMFGTTALAGRRSGTDTASAFGKAPDRPSNRSRIH